MSASIPAVCDRLHERYTAWATDRLATSERLRTARDEWVSFVTASHGDVFASMDAPDARDRLFVDTLSYDFVVERLLAAAERRADVTVENRQATVPAVRFHETHETVVDGRDVAEDLISEVDVAEIGPSFLRGLYEHTVSEAFRRPFGQYYTPRGLAETAVETLDVEDWVSETVLDPGCGSGVFLTTCIESKIEALGPETAPETVVDAVTDTVFGIDLNPVAVKSAKLGYLAALLPALASADISRIRLPVVLDDAIGVMGTDALDGENYVPEAVDHIVGNPPWITWRDLPEAQRDAWRNRYVDDLDLFPHSGPASRLGHGNDDISVPYVWVCLSRYLAEGGDASVVLKRDILKGPAGRLFRSQQVGGRPIAVRHVHDFDTLRPFDADVGVAVYTLEADREPSFPVAVDRWHRGASPPAFESQTAVESSLRHETTGLEPVETDDPSSSWIRVDAERRALGECAHEIRHGVKDDAKTVFGIDRERLDTLEPEYVYPYLKSRHLVKYGLFGHDLQLVPLDRAGEENESELRERAPETYAYLDSNRERLQDRSSSWLDEGTFYNCFGLGEYTWAEYKIVWCRLGFKPHFVVVSTVDDETLGERQVVPGDHCMFIATDDEHEAHFLCGLLNSAPYQRSIEGVASEGKASLSKSVVSNLELPAYTDSPGTRRLADLSMRAHDIVPEHTDVSKRAYNERTIDALADIQADIDETVERLLADGVVGDGGG